MLSPPLCDQPFQHLLPDGLHRIRNVAFQHGRLAHRVAELCQNILPEESPPRIQPLVQQVAAGQDQNVEDVVENRRR